MKRRNFIKTFMKSVFITSLLGKFKPSHLFASEMEISHELPRRPFGETGFEVGIFSLGGQATLEYEGKDDEADKIINRSIDLGVNYIDTSAYYGWDRNGVHLPGVSERYIGKVMRFRRNEVYLASKTLGRTYDEAMRDLETTLKNLQTDHIDLWQVHNVRSKEDLNRWSVEDGAIKAFEKAKNEKIIQHIGITGHKDPFALKYGIEHFPFDTILLSLNAADKHDVSFIDSVLPVAVEKNMGIIGMKVAMAVATHHKELQPLPQWRIEKVNKIVPGDMKPPMKAYIWALQNPNISAVISNLWDENFVEENLSLAGMKVELQPG